MTRSNYLSVAEAAAEYGFSKYEIRQWLDRALNPLPHVRLANRIRIDRIDLERHIDQMKTPGPTRAWEDRIETIEHQL